VGSRSSIGLGAERTAVLRDLDVGSQKQRWRDRGDEGVLLRAPEIRVEGGRTHDNHVTHVPGGE